LKKFAASEEVQETMIVARLEKHGPTTTYQFNKMGISSPSARIAQINARHRLVTGENLIDKTTGDADDAFGISHPRVASYFLAGDPSKSMPAKSGKKKVAA
jgi:Helix-turn-helix domain